MPIDLTTDPFYRLLVVLEQNGKADPNVSLFLGVLTDSAERVRRAIADGANANITDGAIIQYHRWFLEAHCADLVAEYDKRQALLSAGD
jgi:hypothetical protein